MTELLTPQGARQGWAFMTQNEQALAHALCVAVLGREVYNPAFHEIPPPFYVAVANALRDPRLRAHVTAAYPDE